MTDTKVQIGQQIKAARIEKGLTLEELGDMIGVKRSAVSKYESGNQNLTVDTIVKIATALGLKVDMRLVK